MSIEFGEQPLETRELGRELDRALVLLGELCHSSCLDVLGLVTRDNEDAEGVLVHLLDFGHSHAQRGEEKAHVLCTTRESIAFVSTHNLRGPRPGCGVGGWNI